MFSKRRYCLLIFDKCSCADISSETNDCDYSRFLDIPPMVYSGCWAGTWRRQLLVAFEAVTRGMFSVKWGKIVVDRGE